MLLEIREKIHGVFATVVLAFICVMFGLWGIQNYLGGGSEKPVASVGDKDFFQNDVNRAYQQFAESLAGMKFDEETIKKQALQKLIRDEVLLQYAQNQHLAASDELAKSFIQSLEYFQKDGKFDKELYQSILIKQGMSSAEFVSRIKKALLMQQVQQAAVDSAFATQSEIERFFKIQNQKRDAEYVSLGLATNLPAPSDAAIAEYYQQHQDAFKTEEQVSIAYVELSLDKLAAEIKANEDELRNFYEEQKSQFSTKERRKISHILFAFSKEADAEQKALQKAQDAKQQLANKDFAQLAKDISEDKGSATKGGDLGLFEAGTMDKALEEAVSRLSVGQVSEPVRSAFGYHLIKVTELVPGETKSYDSVKNELLKAYQKNQAETSFSNLAQELAKVSFENGGTLDPSAQLLSTTIAKTALFTQASGEGIAAEEKVRKIAFSEEVLAGQNSEPVELGDNKIVVLRLLDHKPAAVQPLETVKAKVVAAIQADQAKQQAAQSANKIREAVLSGKTLAQAAEAEHVALKKANGLTRLSTDIAPTLLQAIYRAPKPKAGQPSLVVVDEPNGGKVVLSVTAVIEGMMTDADKQKLPMIERNMGGALGRNQFEAMMDALQNRADVSINIPEKAD